MLKLIGATTTLGIGMPLAFSFLPEEVCEEKKLVRPVDLPIYESIHEVSENINHNEFLYRRYTDLTFEAEGGSIHSAPNREYQDFFRGFQL